MTPLLRYEKCVSKRLGSNGPVGAFGSVRWPPKVLRFGHKRLGLRGNHSAGVTLHLYTCTCVYYIMWFTMMFKVYHICTLSNFHSTHAWLFLVHAKEVGASCPSDLVDLSPATPRWPRPSRGLEWCCGACDISCSETTGDAKTRLYGTLTATENTGCSWWPGSMNCQFVLLDVFGKSHDFLVFEL